jgi:hypothetical protein
VAEQDLPSLPTIERILQRHGGTGKEPSPPAPPPRTYPAPPACCPNDVQQLDLKGPLYLKGSRARPPLFLLKDIVSQAVF